MVWNQPMNAILSFDVEVGKIAMNQGLPLQLSGSFSFSWQILKKRVYKVQKTWYNCNHNEQQCSMIFDNWQLMTVLLDILVSKTKRGEKPLAKLWALLVGLATKNRFLGQARQHAVSRACLRNKWETMPLILTVRISLAYRRLKLVRLQHGLS